MTRSSINVLRLALPFAAALAMTACGGGGSGGSGFFPIVTGGGSSTPAQDDGRTDAFMAYVKDLVNRLIDTSEPLDVTAFDPPPTSDTREPIATP